jgi:hypothetical protein
MEDAARIASVNIAMRRRRFTAINFRRPRARGENKIWRHSPGAAVAPACRSGSKARSPV